MWAIKKDPTFSVQEEGRIYENKCDAGKWILCIYRTYSTRGSVACNSVRWRSILKDRENANIYEEPAAMEEQTFSVGTRRRKDIPEEMWIR